ncbi:hypothetical protein [Acetobacter sp.]|jgi:hypothetical protein|uniref:hypothetical protein n=1 Tax=Acetobacter sp. TaxID=440 RepID=UPI0025BB7742|nr:hypothetical protein [Acetobacter sp.]MCH4091415.1 hypothetical protein [Acetobacter sp.]MCI1299393.1 hypothetical protein [Acetobacter sp.]MCI1316603.1 hypothetical protein [Acetobacter sp.]
MATGDSEDIFKRIRSTLPQSWFPASSENATPVLDGILTGLAWPWAMLYKLLGYTQNQTRLDTSSGNFIDIAASDYFGNSLPRLENESDSSYIERIKQEFFTKRNTREAFDSVKASDSSIERIVEPWSSVDCACYGRDTYDSTSLCYGSRTSPGTVFIMTSGEASFSVVSHEITGIKAEGTEAILVASSSD